MPDMSGLPDASSYVPNLPDMSKYMPDVIPDMPDVSNMSQYMPDVIPDLPKFAKTSQEPPKPLNPFSLITGPICGTSKANEHPQCSLAWENTQNDLQIEKILCASGKKCLVNFNTLPNGLVNFRPQKMGLNSTTECPNSINVFESNGVQTYTRIPTQSAVCQYRKA